MNQIYEKDGLTTFIEPGWYPETDSDVRPQHDRIQGLAHLLQGKYDQIRVHNIVSSGEWYHRVNSRLVQFMLVSPDKKEKVIFSVIVRQQYCDGDEVSGWTAWSAASVEIKVYRKGRETGFLEDAVSSTHIYRFAKTCMDRNQAFSEQMRQNLGRCFMYLAEEKN